MILRSTERYELHTSFERLRGRRKSRCSLSSPLITYLPRGGERMGGEKEDGKPEGRREMLVRTGDVDEFEPSSKKKVPGPH